MIEIINLVFTAIIAIASTIVTGLLFFHNYDKANALKLYDLENRIRTLENNNTTKNNEIQDEINAVNLKCTRQTKLFFRLVNYINIELREKVNQLIINSGSENVMHTFSGDREDDK